MTIAAVLAALACLLTVRRRPAPPPGGDLAARPAGLRDDRRKGATR